MLADIVGMRCDGADRHVGWRLGRRDGGRFDGGHGVVSPCRARWMVSIHGRSVSVVTSPSAARRRAPPSLLVIQTNPASAASRVATVNAIPTLGVVSRTMPVESITRYRSRPPGSTNSAGWWPGGERSVMTLRSWRVRTVRTRPYGRAVPSGSGQPEGLGPEGRGA